MTRRTFVAATLLATTCVTMSVGTADETANDARTATLFVFGGNTGFIGFDHAERLGGDKVDPTLSLSMTKDTAQRPRDAALDARGAMYLVNTAHGGSVAVYENPMSATGMRPPDRTVAGDATGITRSPSGIAIDQDNHLLYLSNTMDDFVVFDIESPGSFDGDVAPLRTFDVDMSQFKPEQIRFADGSLYVVDARGGTSDIFVFDDPESLSGKVKPDRVINFAGFDNKIGIDVDEQGRLLVAVRKLGQVLVFCDAKSLDGAVEPSKTLSIADTDVKPQPAFATTDSQGRLYVADASGNAVFSFDDLTELETGDHTPDRTIKSRKLIVPNRLLVVERE